MLKISMSESGETSPKRTRELSELGSVLSSTDDMHAHRWSWKPLNFAALQFSHLSNGNCNSTSILDLYYED